MNSSHQVKQLRLQRAWSQEQLAELAGVSVRTIQRIENGDRPGLEQPADPGHSVEHRRQPPADDGVIVDQQYPDHASIPFAI